MTTIAEILYSNGDSISVFEKKLLLSHVLGFSNEKLNLTHSKKIGEKFHPRCPSSIHRLSLFS